MEEENEKLKKIEEKKLPPQRRKRIRTKKGSELYIDSKEMMKELEHFNDTTKRDEDGEIIEKGEITEALGEMFLKLARRYTSKPNFVGYSYRDEMISESVHRMISQIAKFDVTHPSKNPFAYFTQICFHQCLTMINKEKRQSEIKENIRTKIWDEVCHEENIVNQHQEREDSDM